VAQSSRHAQPAHRVRGAVNLVNLSTPAGLVLARFGAGAVRRGPEDLWLADRYRLPLPKAPAFTVGSVILLRRPLPGWPEDAGAAIPARLLAHEARHSTQYAMYGGLVMIPAYLLAAGWSWLRTGDPGSRNLFERAAGLADGGYRERPVRPLTDALAQVRRLVSGRLSSHTAGSGRQA
jgi:hypothetical protein